MAGVLIIVENLPVPFDRRVWNEATTLRQSGFDVSVICPTGKGHEARYECIDGVHIYRHPLLLDARGALGYLLEYSCALFWEFLLAIRVWRRHGFQVIHACNPPDLIFLVGGLFKLFFHTKFVFDHHDLNPELYQAKFGRRDVFYWLMTSLERCTFALADLSIATNESYRRIAIERGKMPPERVHIVRSGPKLDRIRIAPPVPALRRGRRYLVGYVGVMGKQEGIEYLLDAAQIIVYEFGRSDIHFTLVGDGPELAHLRRLSDGMRLSDFVEFPGRLSDADLLAVLNTADVCVNPDEYSEMNDKSTMNKIMEYMALGKPIVQFDLREGRFSAQESSLYAAPNDARDLATKIVYLIERPEVRKMMGEVGRRRVVEELSWPHEAAKLLEAYRQLLPQAVPHAIPADASHR